MQLDHILAPQAWKGLVQDVTANPAIAFNSNHYLVTAVLRIKRAKVGKPPPTQTHIRQPDTQTKQAYNTLIASSIAQQATTAATDPEGAQHEKNPRPDEAAEEDAEEKKEPSTDPDPEVYQMPTRRADGHGDSSGRGEAGHTGDHGMGFVWGFGGG